MTPQERALLEGLFARVRAASGQHRDPEADAFIVEQIRQSPHAAYLLSQTVIVQEEALKGAAGKIDELNARIAELEDARNAAPAQPGSFLGGIGQSLFGGADDRPRGSVPSAGGQRDYSAPPAAGFGQAPRPNGPGIPNVPPPGGRWTQQGRPLAGAEQPQQQGGGGSFLKGALGAAAGVAGGALLANSLSGLFKDSAGAEAKAGQKGDAQTAAAPASEQRQPWGADAHDDTASAADDGFDEDEGWADEDDGDGWSDDE